MDATISAQIARVLYGTAHGCTFATKSSRQAGHDAWILVWPFGCMDTGNEKFLPHLGQVNNNRERRESNRQMFIEARSRNHSNVRVLRSCVAQTGTYGSVRLPHRVCFALLI
jgi:hypothetical protein